ncbi:hypothetical protein M430DRAFT_153311 [Amorphotheca resinae ATCC 22711]|jgi:hypothetical protein|uniref:Uncharacterized protein n=1 Tax=Amorphotheca resinae ATCC 22711 TaxID=857342 RepID=A0A2T3BDC7_AMORE|nr:hypothetical protein M430DRAFT_153311 [Amorphotheca resinae ATCC 22711]PSS27372.1 hypothetical protein M430DRAFT_153311 [Amorphotheca resinae ATCC 22711]
MVDAASGFDRSLAGSPMPSPWWLACLPKDYRPTSDLSLRDQPARGCGCYHRFSKSWAVYSGHRSRLLIPSEVCFIERDLVLPWTFPPVSRDRYLPETQAAAVMMMTGGDYSTSRTPRISTTARSDHQSSFMRRLARDLLDKDRSCRSPHERSFLRSAISLLIRMG